MKKSICIIFIISLQFISAWGYIRVNVPEYNSYISEVYEGKAAPLSLSSEYAKLFKTRLSNALTEPVNFAGEYVMVSWGCGTDCITFSFVNKKTGEVLEETFGGEEGAYIPKTYANSYLLITYDEYKDSKNSWTLGHVANYYILVFGRFKKLISIPITEKHYFDAMNPDRQW